MVQSMCVLCLNNGLDLDHEIGNAKSIGARVNGSHHKQIERLVAPGLRQRQIENEQSFVFF